MANQQFKTKIKKGILYRFVNNCMRDSILSLSVCVNTHDFYLNKFVQFISDNSIQSIVFMIIVYVFHQKFGFP